MPGIAALAVCYVLSQFFRSFLAVLSPVLISELGATKSDLALASGGFFLTFGLMQFAVGVALDHYGPRRTASLIFGVFAGAGAIVFALAQGPGQLILAMALIGVACAPVLMASYFIYARNFHASRFAVLTSWLVAFGMLGNVISASPLAAAADAFGWRTVMAGLGVISMALAAAVFFLADDPEGVEAEEKPGLSGYLTLMKDRRFWPLIPVMVISYAPVVGIRGLWAGPYLHDVFGADAAAIGTATLWMAFGMIAGSFLYGPADRLFKSQKWVIFGGNLVSLAAIAFLAIYPVSSIAFVTIALTAIGLFGLSYGLQMAHARSFMRQDLVGRGVTLMNFFNIFGVGMMQFATGAVVKNSTSAAAPEAGYSALFWFYAALLAVSLVIFAFSQDAIKAPATG
jgi:sugar phosphate permease